MIEMLKSKIHRATVTDANLNYEGSITIYSGLMKAANIQEYEKVSVVNLHNGERFETYVITGADPDNAICINGAAARLAYMGDKVIIMSYRMCAEKKTDGYRPIIVLVDEYNQIIQVAANGERHFVSRRHGDAI